MFGVSKRGEIPLHTVFFLKAQPVAICDIKKYYPLSDWNQYSSHLSSLLSKLSVTLCGEHPPGNGLLLTFGINASPPPFETPQQILQGGDNSFYKQKETLPREGLSVNFHIFSREEFFL